MQRLLLDSPARLDDLALALDLGRDTAFDEAERVHILQLGLRAEHARAHRSQRHVCIGAQGALFHVDVTDPEATQRRAQQRQPFTRVPGRAQLGLGDDLDERGATAIEIDDRALRAVDAPALAHVDQLRRILLEVHAVQAHARELAAATDWLVVL